MLAAAGHPPGREAPLLRIEQLGVAFTGTRKLQAVDGVSLTVNRGRTLCIIGESGSGKSVTMQAVMRLLPERATRYSGHVWLGDRDVLALDRAALQQMRGAEVAMVFQEPMSALDPVHTIGQQLTDTIGRHERIRGRAARRRALEMLELVQVPDPQRRIDSYPHELSGGLRQRAMIALAVSCGPKLLLADEPTTALDATVQIQVLLLLRRLQRELDMGLVLVTHDLGVAAEIADDVAVMYAGRLVETGPVGALMARPAHPYTAALLASSVHAEARDGLLTAIPGAPPDLNRLPPGCSFAPRCAHVTAECLLGPPEERWAGTRMARCLRTEPAFLPAH